MDKELKKIKIKRIGVQNLKVLNYIITNNDEHIRTANINQIDDYILGDLNKFNILLKIFGSS